MGAYAKNYYVNLGAIGILMPFAFAALVTLIFYFGFSQVRAVNTYNSQKAYDYASIARAMYGRKLSRFAMPIYELWLIMSMILTGASCLSAGGSIISQLTGWSVLAGAIIMALINLLVALRGTEFLKKYATLLMAIMIVLFITLVCLALYLRGDNLVYLVSTGWTPDTSPGLAVGMWRVFMLACSTSIWSLGLGIVAQKMVTRGQTFAAALLSGLGGAMVFIFSSIIVLAYCPEILETATPSLVIVTTFMAEYLPWLPTLFYLLMFLAIVDVATAQLVVSERVKKLVPAASRGDGKLAGAVIGVVYLIACICFSLFGLDVIVGTFYQYLGYVGIFMTVIPLVFIWPILRRRGIYPKMWWLKDNGATASDDGDGSDDKNTMSNFS
jgi:uncharacterized membrane protein YkvI